MFRRVLKYLLIGVGGIFAVLVGLFAFAYFFPPTYEAATELPGTNSKVIVRLRPMHLYLAEYRRALVLRKSGVPDQQFDMFPDTGGYSRTQLYQLDDGRFVMRGFFDSVVIDANAHTISTPSAALPENNRYLGAFDDTGDGRWRFI